MTTEEVDIFKFKINGVEIASGTSHLNARAILELAAEHRAIPGDPEDYMLVGKEGEYGMVEEIDIVTDDLLISIPTGPTQVADRMNRYDYLAASEDIPGVAIESWPMPDRKLMTAFEKTFILNRNPHRDVLITRFREILKSKREATP